MFRDMVSNIEQYQAKKVKAEAHISRTKFSVLEKFEYDLHSPILVNFEINDVEIEIV